MFNSHLKIAWRSLAKDKFYTVLNVMGLALATAAFLLIIYFVRFEYSYEHFYKRADNIVRITMDLYKGNEFVTTDCETHPPLAPLLKKDFPEVVDAARIQMGEEVSQVKVGEQRFPVEKVYFADPAAFQVFNYDFITGNAHALDAPGQVVLTESEAHRLFGNAPAMGKTISMLQHRLFTVTGVIKDLPLNTHLKMNMLISFASLKELGMNLDSWNGNNNYTYVQLRPGTDLGQFNEKLKTVAHQHLNNDNIFVAQFIKDIHLYSHRAFEPEVNGDAKTVRFLLIIALLIIGVGAVNYVNLTTARATEKVKETGIRKVLGSSRMALVSQFMAETFIVNLLALAVAMLVIMLALPSYLQLIGRPIPGNPFASTAFWGWVAALFVCNCVLSGIYPALVLSNTAPVTVTRRVHTQSSKGAFFRKTLVVAQFVAALVVLSAACIVYRQLNYLRHQQLGINTSQVLVVRNPEYDGADSLREQQVAVFKNNLQQLPGVQQVSVSGSVPGADLSMLSTMIGLSQYGSPKGKGYNYYLYSFDADFIPNMGMKLIAGENFRAGQPNKGYVILSREAVKRFGFASPEAAIGQRITLGLYQPPEGGDSYAIVHGVVEDYHQQSLKSALLPMIHWYDPSGSYSTIRLKPGADVHAAVQQVEALWNNHFAGYPMEYHFMDEMYNEQYKADEHFGQIVTVFSGFTLFITCLGILGLTAYNIARRTKEIGIRKVLGASVSGIVSLLSKDMVKLVSIALLIATPLTWYVMSKWLQDFAYHINIQWWIFAGAGVLTMGIALLTVGWQSLKAALVNPVKALKAE
ncbi:hypothetical protein DCC81_14345 [Chitinophaga parva]|uniref:Cell division protein FtsX n=1 Tax=Chitinophaga parva TaxID=2169414 RepID=A0A2T7BGR0_9BACT|nr:ABC transporter permease [Chitinophaga parva]PUZ25464.1 hypothetical protein DCC81_14345 [Chitinophaga parva]